MSGMLFLAYGGFGLLFALWFFLTGHGRIDPSSRDSAWYTRLLWCPAALLLWPVLLTKLRNAKQDGKGTEA